jgi:hypothetical protein
MDKDILVKLLTPVTWTTIDGVDVMGHPDGALDDLLKEAADEIERQRIIINSHREWHKERWK